MQGPEHRMCFVGCGATTRVARGRSQITSCRVPGLVWQALVSTPFAPTRCGVLGGDMRLEVSRNGFQTLVQQVRMTTREWTRGMTNRPQETPPPPTVPYLADQWPFEHYGFPSVLPLDERNRPTARNGPNRWSRVAEYSLRSRTDSSRVLPAGQA